MKDHLAPLLSRPVGVLGAGISGRSVVAWLKQRGIPTILYDERVGRGDQNDFTLQAAQTHGLVIFSPGFDPRHPWLDRARQAGVLCFGELEFAGYFWPGRLIGITGTNGKTTLTHFLQFALKRLGIDAIAVGNIGCPLCSTLETQTSSRERVAVCEISSFQAESLRQLRLDTLIWTNFSEDHLDRHRDLETYFRAKWRLLEVSHPPRVIVGESVAKTAHAFGYRLPHHTMVIESNETEEEDVFDLFPHCENNRIARAFWRYEGYPEAVLRSSAHAFQLPQYRLGTAIEVDGIRFWNDSKATNFAAALAAVQTVKGPVYWIGGGQSKGGDIEAFAVAMARRIESAFLIGSVTSSLAPLLKIRGIHTQTFSTLEAAVDSTWQRAQPETDIVFSPGFSSFDQFTDYAQRGKCFENAVLQLRSSSAAAANRLAPSAL